MRRKRIYIINAFFALGSLVLIGRLYQLQVLKYNKYSSMACKDMTCFDWAVPRGGIYDRLGREMALSVQVPSAYVITKKSSEPNYLLRPFPIIPGLMPSLLGMHLKGTRVSCG